MRKYLREAVQVVKQRRRACLFALILVVSGCILGNAFAMYVDADKQTEFMKAVESFYKNGAEIEVDKVTLFFESLKEYTYSFILILVCSFSVWFIPVVFMKLVFEGFCMGLASGMMSKVLGLRGFFHSGLSLFVRNIFYIPLLVIFAVYAIRKAKRRGRRNYKTVALEMIFVLLLSGVGGLLECIVSSGLIMKLI